MWADMKNLVGVNDATFSIRLAEQRFGEIGEDK
jgi:hypothetical protein